MSSTQQIERALFRTRRRPTRGHLLRPHRRGREITRATPLTHRDPSLPPPRFRAERSRATLGCCVFVFVVFVVPSMSTRLCTAFLLLVKRSCAGRCVCVKAACCAWTQSASKSLLGHRLPEHALLCLSPSFISRQGRGRVGGSSFGLGFGRPPLSFLEYFVFEISINADDRWHPIFTKVPKCCAVLVVVPHTITWPKKTA